MSIFTSFQQRAAERSPANVLVVSEVGMGKTYQANHFPGDETLFVDMEAGHKSIDRNWTGTSIDVRNESNKLGVHPWALCQALACLISGPNPMTKPEDPYSYKNYHTYVEKLGGDGQQLFGQFKYVFWDSLSVASRHAFEYYAMQPEFKAKSGEADMRAVYGEVGRQLTNWYTVIQHTKGKSTIVTAILERSKDEHGRQDWDIQVVGNMGKKTIVGIFDHVIAIANVPDGQGGHERAFICQSPNPLGIDGLKSRGFGEARLNLVEGYGNPNLCALINRLES